MSLQEFIPFFQKEAEVFMGPVSVFEAEYIYFYYYKVKKERIDCPVWMVNLFLKIRKHKLSSWPSYLS